MESQRITNGLRSLLRTLTILPLVGVPAFLTLEVVSGWMDIPLLVGGFMTWCAIGMVSCQVVFAFNFFYSMFFGQAVGRNPWGANSLDWMAPSPPGHGNFDFQPIVYRGPYEYGSPETDEDYYLQTQPPPSPS